MVNRLSLILVEMWIRDSSIVADPVTPVAAQVPTERLTARSRVLQRAEVVEIAPDTTKHLSIELAGGPVELGGGL